jgi:hypothetical protein
MRRHVGTMIELSKVTREFWNLKNIFAADLVDERR